MHGPLHEIGLIEVLQLLERGGRSGVLRVVGPEPAVPRTLRLHQGRVVAVDPDADDAAVVRALVRSHLQPAATGEADAALVDPGEREAVRQRLARTALGTVLHWTSGRFDFSEGPTGVGPLSWGADALVMALVEDESRRVELAEALEHWHAVPAFADAQVVAAGERVVLETLDWRILDAVNGIRDVAAIAALLGEPLEDVGERVRTLVAAAILQLHPAASEPPASGEVQSGRDERHEEMVERYRARIRRAPGDAEAWRSLGLAEVGAGRFDRAIEAWTAWQRVAPERADDAATLILAARTMMEALRESHE